jgi:hypothetical protein
MQNILKFCKLYQFADDSSVVNAIFEEKDRINLQSEINKFYEWSINMELKINAMKNKYIRFIRKQNLYLNNYEINCFPIKTVTHKHFMKIIRINEKFWFLNAILFL